LWIKITVGSARVVRPNKVILVGLDYTSFGSKGKIGSVGGVSISAHEVWNWIGIARREPGLRDGEVSRLRFIGTRCG